MDEALEVHVTKDGSCDGMVLAMAYVPSQRWIKTYSPEEGFDYGTIFPCLNKPFLGREVADE